MSDDGVRDANKAAVEGLAADIAAHGNDKLASAFGGSLNSESAHAIAAEVARGADRGRMVSLGELIAAAKRRKS